MLVHAPWSMASALWGASALWALGAGEQSAWSIEHGWMAVLSFMRHDLYLHLYVAVLCGLLRTAVCLRVDS